MNKLQWLVSILVLLVLSFGTADVVLAQEAPAAKEKQAKDAIDKELEKAKKQAEKAKAKEDKAKAKEAAKAAAAKEKEADAKVQELREQVAGEQADKAAKSTKAKAEKEAKKAKDKAAKSGDDASARSDAAKGEKSDKKSKEEKEPEKKLTKAEKKEIREDRNMRRSEYQRPYKAWSFNAMAGATSPLTDIRYGDFFTFDAPVTQNRWGGQFSIMKMLNGAFGLQLQGKYVNLVGVSDTFMDNMQNVDYYQDMAGQLGFDPNRGVLFDSKVGGGSLNIYWSISNTVANMNRRLNARAKGKLPQQRRVSLYTYTGFGFSHHNTQLKYLDDESDIPNNLPGLNSDKRVEMYIPWAIGIKFRLTPGVDIGWESAFHFLLSDNLDAAIYDFPGRGRNDRYMINGLTMSVKLGSKKRDKEHLEWVNPTEDLADDVADLKKKVDRLTRDNDNDGVSDYFDKQLDTPDSVMVDGSGIAMDIDQDGVPDYMDEEVFTPDGAEVDETGKSKDTDKDGVPDFRDLEPDTKLGSLVNFRGITIPTYGTGEDGRGTPLEAAMRGIYLPSVYFDLDRIDIKRDFHDELFEVARVLKENPGMKIFIVGHTDEIGKDNYNLDLGMRRAESIKKFLIENYGIPSAALEPISKGEKDLVSPNDEINRRVDFLLKP